MKFQLTLEQSKELTSYSNDADENNDYIYSLQDLLTILPHEIIYGDLVYELIMSCSNEKSLAGYFTEFSWWNGDSINSSSCYFIYENELIDALFKLTIWYLSSQPKNNEDEI